MKIISNTVADTELATLTETAANHAASIVRLDGLIKDGIEGAKLSKSQHEQALKEVQARISQLTKPKQ